MEYSRYSRLGGYQRTHLCLLTDSSGYCWHSAHFLGPGPPAKYCFWRSSCSCWVRCLAWSWWSLETAAWTTHSRWHLNSPSSAGSASIHSLHWHSTNDAFWTCLTFCCAVCLLWSCVGRGTCWLQSVSSSDYSGSCCSWPVLCLSWRSLGCLEWCSIASRIVSCGSCCCSLVCWYCRPRSWSGHCCFGRCGLLREIAVIWPCRCCAGCFFGLRCNANWINGRFC